MRTFLAAALLALSTPLVSQTSAKIDVKVVNVDVSVIGANGQPVTDLKPADFQLFEDNHPETITNFALVHGSPDRDGSRQSDDVELRRRVILLVDNNYVDKTNRDTALRALDQFIDSTFDGSYEWALGIIGENLKIVQPFTSDRTAIHSAIAAICKSATTTFREANNRSLLDDTLYQASGLDVPAEFESREQTTRSVRSLANSTRALIESMRLFAPVEGKKMMVLLTGSMDLNTTFAAFDTGSDRETADLKTETAKLIDAIVHEAGAANIGIDVLRVAPHEMAVAQHDVSNHSSGSGVEGININAGSDVRDTSAAWTIAAGTGGLFLSSNSIADSINTVDAAARTYYLLGYEPGHGDDRQYHRIDVRVTRPGVRVIHRQGYLDLPAEERLERLLRLQISALQPSTSVPVTVDVTHINVPGKPAVSMLAAMPMTRVTLLPKDGRYVGSVDIYLSIFDASGRNVGFHHEVQPLSFSPDQRDKALADAFRYRMNVRLDKGEFTLAITMRDDLSNDFGTAVQKVKL